MTVLSPSPAQRLRLTDLLLLALLAVVLFAPGQTTLPPIDRDEARYAVATSQMLASGDFIDIRFQDEARHLQPAGIYWLQSLAVGLFSDVSDPEIWAHRIPSLIGAIGAVVGTAWLAGLVFGRVAGLVAGGLLALSLLLGVEARLAKIDATMLAVVVTAQGSLWLLYLDRAVRPRLAAGVFWVAIGVGLMLKGPIPTMVSALTILALVVVDRRVAWLRRLHAGWGVPLALAIVLPWLIAIVVRTEGAFLTDAIGHSMLGKVTTGQQAHGAPPGYHLLAFNIAFWPGALFSVVALPHLWRNRREPAFRFLLAWIVPSWVVFELVATKLPHYTLPLYPAIAAFTGAAVASMGLKLPGGRWRTAMLAYVGLWGAIGLALAAAGTVFAIISDRRIDPVALAVTLIAGACIVLAVRFAFRDEMLRAAPVAAAAALVIWTGTFGWTLPRIDGLWLSPRIDRAVETAAADCPATVLVTTPYHEPSLVYLHGPEETHLARTPEEAAERLSEASTCRFALVGAAERERFLARVAQLDVGAEPAGRIEGRNYSNGRLLELTLFRVGERR